MLSLLKKGIYHAIHGNGQKFKQFAQSRLKDRFGEQMASDFVRYYDPGVSVPDWIDYNDEFSVVRYDDYDYREYVLSPVDNADGPFSLSPPEAFDAVSFALVDVACTERAVIDATFTTTADQTVTKSMMYSPMSHSRDGLDSSSIEPVRITAPEPSSAVEISVSVESAVSRNENRTNSLVRRFSGLVGEEHWKMSPDPWVSLPSVSKTRDSGPPIFVFTIDTLRYDYLDAFEPVIDALGADATVPSEPRTQGYWTRPAHSSLLTGVHPAEHGYVGRGFRVDPSLVRLAELLSEEMYRCSGIVTQPTIGPEQGLGDGFHRFQGRIMSWAKRNHDAYDITSRLRKWVDADTDLRSGDLFYFAHLFDPHSPYYPPREMRHDDDLDMDVIDDLLEYRFFKDYVDVLEAEEPTFDEDDLEQLRRYYRKSVEYVAEALVDFVEHLKRRDVFEDAFIVITGDHGEDFAEGTFMGHNSLYDTNIRPGMVVKPPTESQLKVPDEADLIDVFPTIADLLDVPVPEQCAGKSWVCENDPEPRVVERISEDWYNIAVEAGGYKAIFTYEQNYPNRSTEAQLESGPVATEWYRLDDSDPRPRRSMREEAIESPPSRYRSEFENIAESFVRAGLSTEHAPAVTQSRDLTRRLEDLGYK
jgi:arylsulfatase A-like enzyme